MINKLIDTIVAVSTPRGSGGIGIVRVSGLKSFFIACEISKKKIKSDRIERVSFFNKKDVLLDIGLILYFKNPKSFTGEDVVEFHAHGNDLILDSLVLRAIELGARLAEPGEFSFRAFFNDKIDLLQAESINALIRSNFLYCNNFILKSLSGVFSEEIITILDRISLLRRDLEACIEFPDDIFFDFKVFLVRFKEVVLLFNTLFNKISGDYFISDSFKVVILGDVNVGKSSFFNFLLKSTRSIVSNVPGTTRDFIDNDFEVDGFNFKLVDTAGFNSNSNCEIEKSGIIKTFEQIEKASVVIFMFDATNCIDPMNNIIFRQVLDKYSGKLKFFVLRNKIDLINCDEKLIFHDKYTELYISVKDNKGIDLFLNELKHILFNVEKTSYMVNKRHYELFLKAKKCLSRLNDYQNDNFILDICAEDLKHVYIYLSDILGRQSSNNVINEVFSNFCIGK